MREPRVEHERSVIQFGGKPLLLGGLKFDMRMYVLVAGGSMGVSSWHGPAPLCFTLSSCV